MSIVNNHTLITVQLKFQNVLCRLNKVVGGGYSLPILFGIVEWLCWILTQDSGKYPACCSLFKQFSFLVSCEVNFDIVFGSLE